MNTKLLKNYIIYFSATGLSAVAALASSIIYTKLFSPEVFGKYDLVNTTYLVLYVFLSAWITSSFFRYYLEYKHRNLQEQLFNSIFFILSVINIIVLILFFFMYKFILKQEIVFLIFLFSFNVLPRSLVELFTTKFKLDDSMRAYFLVTVSNSFGNLAVSVFLILVAGLGIMSLILAPVIVSAAILLVLALRYRSFFKFRFDKEVLKDFWQYGGPLIITGLINIALSLSDRYIIRYFYSTREVGIYGFAYSMSDRFFRIFVSVFSLTIQTYLMQVWHNNRDNYNRTVKTFTRYYYVTFIPLIFIVHIILDFMFHFNIFDKRYIEGQSMTLIVLAAMFFEGLIYIANRGFAVYKKNQYLRNVSFVVIVVNVSLNIVLVPLLGYKIAAVTTLLAYVMYVLLIYVFSIKKINWKWEFYDRIIFTTLLYWVPCYMLIRFSGNYIVKSLLLAAACVLYLFILPKDIKALLLSFKDTVLQKLKGSEN